MLFIFGRNSGMLKIESKTQLVVFNGMIGGFQLESISISRVINHMTCYNFGGKFIKENTLQDLLSSLNAVISTNESTQIENWSCDL